MTVHQLAPKVSIASTSKSLMVDWLRRVSQGYEMYCHYLEVIGSNNSCQFRGVLYFDLFKSYLNQNINNDLQQTVFQLHGTYTLPLHK